MPDVFNFDERLPNPLAGSENNRRFFFKYMSEDTAKIVLNGQTLRWSTAPYLNDPFDMHFIPRLSANIDAVADEVLEKLWKGVSGPDPMQGRGILIPLLEMMRVNRVFATFEEFSDALRPGIYEGWRNLERSTLESAEEIRAVMRENKILSLTEDPTNNLMWSHYGNSHKGAALVFESVGDAPYRAARPITYSDEYPEIFTQTELIEFYTIGRQTDLEEFGNKLTYWKHSDWRYEKEWRIEAFKGRNREAPYEDVPFGARELAGVIFGLNMSERDKGMLRLLAARYPNVRFYQIHKDSNSYKLSVACVD